MHSAYFMTKECLQQDFSQGESPAIVSHQYFSKLHLLKLLNFNHRLGTFLSFKAAPFFSCVCVFSSDTFLCAVFNQSRCFLQTGNAVIGSSYLCHFCFSLCLSQAGAAKFVFLLCFEAIIVAVCEVAITEGVCVCVSV